MRTVRTPRNALARRMRCRCGFTVVEVMVALVIASVIVGAAFAAMFANAGAYGIQRETIDARESLRAAAAVLMADIVGTSASGGDLYAISADSISVRSILASGVVCAALPSGPSSRIIGVRETSGYFQETTEDSALVYDVDQETWKARRVNQVWNGSASAWTQTPVCFWGDSSVSVPRPQAAIRLQGGAPQVGFVQVGAGVYGFRRVTYALFQQDARWWLGRRVGAGSFETLAGPMRSPGDGGLAFTYRDLAGASTTDPAAVRSVEIALRSESFGRRPRLSGGVGNDPVADSLSLTVFVRN